MVYLFMCLRVPHQAVSSIMKEQEQAANLEGSEAHNEPRQEACAEKKRE